MTTEIKSLISKDDDVAVEAESYGEHPCGVYKNKYHFKFVVKNNLVVEAKEYMDTHHLAAFKTLLDTKACKVLMAKK